MNNTIKKSLAIISTLSVGGLQHASAQVTAVDLGTGLPPATLGSYTVSAFAPSSISGSTGVAHETGGSGDSVGTDGSTSYWATWGQGYTGNVFTIYNGGNPLPAGHDTLTLTLSGN